MQILGSKELLEQVRDKELCVACGACVGICPYHKVHKGKVAMIFECDLSEGSCYAYCPRTEVDFDGISQKLFGTAFEEKALGSYRKIVAAKAGDNLSDGSFQNGGTVSALITLALKKGLVDAAVLTGKKGILPEPQIVTKAEDVINCASTKYMAAPVISALNQGAKDGYEKMGVVGTACQLTAAGQIKCNPLKKDDFKDSTALTVGVFCTWALNTRQFLNFLTERVDIDKIIGMDVPPPPAELFIIKTTDQTIEIPLSEIREMVPKGCSLCPDMTAEWSDVSVGAFEGKPDWNTLIIRTEKGEQLVEMAVKEDYLILGDFPDTSLDHLTLGAGNKKKRAQENAEKETK